MNTVDTIINMTREERAAWQASFTREDKLRIFNSISFLSKEDVIQDINYEITDLEKAVSFAEGSMIKYLSTKIAFLRKFIRKIEETILFSKLEPWWCYQYVISSRGAFLNLVYAGTKVVVSPEDGLFYVPMSDFTVVSVLAKTMTIDEYSVYSGKTAASLRQSLRRGKFRSAFKVGQEWRISELCEPTSVRGYSDGQYQWESELVDVLEGFEYIKEPGFINIMQRYDDKQFFIIEGISNGQYFRNEKVSKVDIERLEHYLIANPFVIFRNDEKKFIKRRDIAYGEGDLINARN